MKVGSGVAVKRNVEVGKGEVGVLDGCGVLLGTAVAVAGCEEATGVTVLGGVGVEPGGWLVGRGVLVLAGEVVGVLLLPGCDVTVGSGVTDVVGGDVGVMDGVSVGVGVAVWALAVSVPAMTV